jgi:hypothetical protein
MTDTPQARTAVVGGWFVDAAGARMVTVGDEIHLNETMQAG